MRMNVIVKFLYVFILFDDLLHVYGYLLVTNCNLKNSKSLNSVQLIIIIHIIDVVQSLSLNQRNTCIGN